ncbi:MAG: phage tail tape measure protein, partial [Niameybacter sp.]
MADDLSMLLKAQIDMTSSIDKMNGQISQLQERLKPLHIKVNVDGLDQSIKEVLATMGASGKGVAKQFTEIEKIVNDVFKNLNIKDAGKELKESLNHMFTEVAKGNAGVMDEMIDGIVADMNKLTQASEKNLRIIEKNTKDIKKTLREDDQAIYDYLKSLKGGKGSWGVIKDMEEFKGIDGFKESLRGLIKIGGEASNTLYDIQQNMSSKGILTQEAMDMGNMQDFAEYIRDALLRVRELKKELREGVSFEVPDMSDAIIGELGDALPKVMNLAPVEKMTNGIKAMTEEERQALVVAEELRQALTYDTSYKGMDFEKLRGAMDASQYEDFKNIAKEVKEEYKELIDVQARFGKDKSGESTGRLDSVLRVYKTGLGEIISETLAWADVTDETGKVVGKQWQTIATTVDNNIEKIEKLENAQTLATQKMKDSISQAETKYVGGLDAQASKEIKAMVEGFEKLNPHTKEYAETVQKVEYAVTQYTKALKVNSQEADRSYKLQEAQSLAIKKMDDSIRYSEGKYTSGFDENDSAEIKRMVEYAAKLNPIQDEYAAILKEVQYAVGQYNKALRENSVEINKTEKQQDKLNFALQEFKKMQGTRLDQMALKGVDSGEIEAYRRRLEALSDTSENVSQDMVALRNDITNLGRTAQSSGKSFKDFLGMAIGINSMYEVFQVGKRAIMDMTRSVIDLDTELTNLQKVSDITGGELEGFTREMFSSATMLGRTGTELIQAVGNFAQAGYAVGGEAERLGEQAMLMQNIGDGIGSVDTATGILISTMKAYNITAEDSVRINDILNQVSNTSAVSFGKL